jgi:hypothetical protein
VLQKTEAPEFLLLRLRLDARTEVRVEWNWLQFFECFGIVLTSLADAAPGVKLWQRLHHIYHFELLLGV